MNQQSRNTIIQDTLSEVLLNESGVTNSYCHVPKEVCHHQPISRPNCLLKWYEIFLNGRPYPKTFVPCARHLMTAACVPMALDSLFYIRCGEDFYFLIASTWRNENELWQAVWYKDGNSMDAFAEFPRNDAQKPTFCVWELVPVWHEQRAWTKFLQGSRNLSAAKKWLSSQYSGVAT